MKVTNGAKYVNPDIEASRPTTGGLTLRSRILSVPPLRQAFENGVDVTGAGMTGNGALSRLPVKRFCIGADTDHGSLFQKLILLDTLMKMITDGVFDPLRHQLPEACLW